LEESLNFDDWHCWRWLQVRSAALIGKSISILLFVFFWSFYEVIVSIGILSFRDAIMYHFHESLRLVSQLKFFFHCKLFVLIHYRLLNVFLLWHVLTILVHYRLLNLFPLWHFLKICNQRIELLLISLPKYFRFTHIKIFFLLISKWY